MSLRDEKLLPCPFCGGKSFISSTLEGDFYVMCETEECFGMTGYTASTQQATESWNRRSLLPSKGWRPIEERDGEFPILVGRRPDKYLWGPYAAFKDITGVWRIHGSEGGMTPLHFEPTMVMDLPPSPPPAPVTKTEGGDDD